MRIWAMKKQSQNKPNLKRAKMDVNIYYTEVYENILCIPSQGKQTQSNPIPNATTVFLRKESLGLLITQEIAGTLPQKPEFDSKGLRMEILCPEG